MQHATGQAPSNTCWMTEDDSKQIAGIEAHYGKAPSIRQGETWLKSVTEMWQAYRRNLPSEKE